MDEATVARILFIGDVVGEAGVAAVERQLPLLRERHRPTFVVANGENADLTGPHPASGCGITPESAERLLAAGVDCLTGGNHSWDGPRAAETLLLQRVLRPLNYGAAAPGRGALVITRDGVRLGVVNVVSRTALPHADTPFDATAAVIDAWDAEDASTSSWSTSTATRCTRSRCWHGPSPGAPRPCSAPTPTSPPATPASSRRAPPTSATSA
jgi:calcineurin-like phosphoesterase